MNLIFEHEWSYSPDACRLFSKFTISTTSYQHIRLATAQLKGEEGEEGLVISSTRPHQRSITVGDNLDNSRKD